MTNNKKRWMYGVSIGLACIIAVLLIIYKTKKQSFLHNGLQTVVTHKTDSIYRITYDSISVDEVAGNLFIKNLHITADTLRQLQLIQHAGTNAAKILLDIYVPLIKVENFKTVKALLSKQLQCNNVTILNPVVTVNVFPDVTKPSDELKQKEQLYQQILGKFNLIEANKISIENSRVTVVDFYTKQTKLFTSKTNVVLQDLHIDSTYNEDTSRTLFCKQINVTCNDLSLGEKDKAAQITDLTFDTKNKIIALANFSYDATKTHGFFKASLNNIKITGFEWKQPVEESQIQIDKIELNNGNIETLTGNSNTKDQGAAANKILTGWIKKFTLNKLQANSFSLTSRSTNKDKKPIIIKNNTITLEAVRIDTLARFDDHLVNNVGNIQLDNDHLSIVSSDKMYTYSVTGFKLNAKARKITIQQIAVIPMFSEDVFAKKAKVQTDRYDAKVNNIALTGLGVNALLKGKMFASNLAINGASLKIYRDLTYPKKKESSIGKDPIQMLFKAKTPIHIQHFQATNALVEYKEKEQKTDTSGVVGFYNSMMSANNISNLPPVKGDKTAMHFSCMFLHKLPLKGSFVFKLDEWKKGTCIAEGEIPSTIDATIFNQLLEPMSLMKFNRGTFDYMKTNVTLDNEKSTGQLLMPYHDLNISMLKRNGSTFSKRDVLSLIANVAIKNKNSNDSNMKVGTIDKQRTPDRSFFNFLWKSIFEGAMKILKIHLPKI